MTRLRKAKSQFNLVCLKVNLLSFGYFSVSSSSAPGRPEAAGLPGGAACPAVPAQARIHAYNSRCADRLTEVWLEKQITYSQITDKKNPTKFKFA